MQNEHVYICLKENFLLYLLNFLSYLKKTKFYPHFSGLMAKHCMLNDSISQFPKKIFTMYSCKLIHTHENLTNLNLIKNELNCLSKAN